MLFSPYASEASMQRYPSINLHSINLTAKISSLTPQYNLLKYGLTGIECILHCRLICISRTKNPHSGFIMLIFSICIIFVCYIYNLGCDLLFLLWISVIVIGQYIIVDGYQKCKNHACAKASCIEQRL